MRLLKTVTVNLLIVTILASVCGFFASPNGSISALAETEGWTAAVAAVAVVSLLIFAPSFALAAMLTTLITAIGLRVSRSWCAFVTLLAALILFPTLQIGGILLVNGPSVPLIQNGTPYLLAAFSAGVIYAVVSLLLAFRSATLKAAV